MRRWLIKAFERLGLVKPLGYGMTITENLHEPIKAPKVRQLDDFILHRLSDESLRELYHSEASGMHMIHLLELAEDAIRDNDSEMLRTINRELNTVGQHIYVQEDGSALVGAAYQGPG